MARRGHRGASKLEGWRGKAGEETEVQSDRPQATQQDSKDFFQIAGLLRTATPPCAPRAYPRPHLASKHQALGAGLSLPTPPPPPPTPPPRPARHRATAAVLGQKPACGIQRDSSVCFFLQPQSVTPEKAFRRERGTAVVERHRGPGRGLHRCWAERPGEALPRPCSRVAQTRLSPSSASRAAGWTRTPHGLGRRPSIPLRRQPGLRPAPPPTAPTPPEKPRPRGRPGAWRPPPVRPGLARLTWLGPVRAIPVRCVLPPGQREHPAAAAAASGSCGPDLGPAPGAPPPGPPPPAQVCSAGGPGRAGRDSAAPPAVA
ncbi:translation initiation factor IF-2-like [Canis lupus familiaris]|uniref:translation initiation factor IF-2-like n=1 Tax=Canis lupus familiaris TaxID=9615 RepID=UPI0018F4D273|nr:translation initiation factor IF-2-like [Canis lupus familiaris]